MNYEIKHKGAFPIIIFNLDEGESIKAESDAMISVSSNMSIKGSIDGGLIRGLGRLLAGEKFFFQNLTAKDKKGTVRIGASTIGDIEVIDLDGSYKLVVQKDGFLAGSESIVVSSRMQNLYNGLYSGTGFFVLDIGGVGQVFLSAYGAIEVINLEENEEILIDNGHLVAWPDYMKPKITKASKGWISSFLSGEKLVCKFKGPGPVLIQTRNPSSFGSWIQQFLPTAESKQK